MFFLCADAVRAHALAIVALGFIADPTDRISVCRNRDGFFVAHPEYRHVQFLFHLVSDAAVFVFRRLLPAQRKTDWRLALAGRGAPPAPPRPFGARIIQGRIFRNGAMGSRLYIGDVSYLAALGATRRAPSFDQLTRPYLSMNRRRYSKAAPEHRIKTVASVTPECINRGSSPKPAWIP